MIETIAELATRPGHEKVRALLHGLLVHGLRIPSADVSFEEQGTEVRGRMDALLGRTVIEIKSDLPREAAGMDPGKAVAASTERVIGIDVHPVAAPISRFPRSGIRPRVKGLFFRFEAVLAFDEDGVAGEIDRAVTGLLD